MKILLGFIGGTAIALAVIAYFDSVAAAAAQFDAMFKLCVIPMVVGMCAAVGARIGWDAAGEAPARKPGDGA